jgi:hypothetical protein
MLEAAPRLLPFSRHVASLVVHLQLSPALPD